MIMNNLFKKIIKKDEKIQSSEVKNIPIEDKIISAEEALAVSSSKWSNVSNEEIFEKINSETQRGKRNAWFWDSKITEEQVSQLKELGYKVIITSSHIDNIPYFKVSW